MIETTQKSDRFKIANAEFYDGNWSRHPSADVFLILEDELTDLHSSEIDLNWATKRFKQGLLDWVSSAIVIKKVFRFRLWKDRFSDWKDYCIIALGKKAEAIKMLIDCAEVVIELAHSGFTILPTNQSQVTELKRCCKKLDCLIYDAWEKVINSIPSALITSQAIAEVLGFPRENTTYRVPRELDEKLTKQALDLGMSKTELHSSIIQAALEEEGGELDETENIEPDKLEAWEQDVDQLVAEYDHQNWLMVSLIKLISLVQSKRQSNFNFLADYRLECCQSP